MVSCKQSKEMGKSTSARLDQIQVIEVCRTNLDAIWPYLLVSLKQADFIAIDLVFNILSLCAEPFTVEPEALEFLGKHAFDFNRLIDIGVRYYPSTVSK
ncbi:hypothetical protein TELCIR_16803, partial [Teladorsagia circumcincta]